MTIDEFFRDQISRGQPPMVALNNAAQAYADSLRKRPDCSQYADETAAWDEPEKSLVDEFLETAEGRRQFAYEKLKYELEEAVELLRDAINILGTPNLWGQLSKAPQWSTRVRNFLEGKQ